MHTSLRQNISNSDQCCYKFNGKVSQFHEWPSSFKVLNWEEANEFKHTQKLVNTKFVIMIESYRWFMGKGLG